ncbi:MAG: hypothetical protein AAF705_21920 [Bacteroidota bacterium]
MAEKASRERLFKGIIIASSILLFYAGVRYLTWSGWVDLGQSREKLEVKRFDQQVAKDKRILILGDSQLERWPVEHCLYRDLGKYCYENGYGYVNAAHHGFGPIEYLDGFRNIAPTYKPDLTIVFYYAGNDLSDVAYREGRSPKQRTHGNVTIMPMERSPFFKAKAPAPKTGLTKLEREALIAPHPFNWEQFRRIGIDEEMIRFAENRLINPKTIGAEYVNPHVLVFGSWKPNQLYDNLALESPNSQYAWYQILVQFEALLDEAEKIGSKVAFVCIPSTAQVDESHHDFYRRTKFRVGPDLLEKAVPQKLLEQFCEKANVPYVDLLPTFKAAAPSKALYFDFDDHLNSNGHELAFETVKNQMLDPYLVGDFAGFWQQREKNQQTKFLEAAAGYQIDIIRSNPEWLANIQQKADAQGVSLESALYQDALYVLRQAK